MENRRQIERVLFVVFGFSVLLDNKTLLRIYRRLVSKFISFLHQDCNLLKNYKWWYDKYFLKFFCKQMEIPWTVGYCQEKLENVKLSTFIRVFKFINFHQSQFYRPQICRNRQPYCHNSQIFQKVPLVTYPPPLAQNTWNKTQSLEYLKLRVTPLKAESKVTRRGVLHWRSFKPGGKLSIRGGNISIYSWETRGRYRAKTNENLSEISVA